LLFNFLKFFLFQMSISIFISLHAIVNEVDHLKVDGYLFNCLHFVACLDLAVDTFGLDDFGHSLSSHDAALSDFYRELTLEVFDGLGGIFHFQEDG
jgi:hypothetical protein